MMALDLPCLMYSVTELARPKMLVFPPSPRQIPQTTVDFPVPLAPMTTFNPGPGKISTFEYVLNTIVMQCTASFNQIRPLVTQRHPTEAKTHADIYEHWLPVAEDREIIILSVRNHKAHAQIKTHH